MPYVTMIYEASQLLAVSENTIIESVIHDSTDICYLILFYNYVIVLS